MRKHMKVCGTEWYNCNLHFHSKKQQGLTFQPILISSRSISTRIKSMRTNRFC